MANTVVQSNPPVSLLLGLAKNGGIQQTVVIGVTYITIVKAYSGLEKRSQY